MADMAGMQEMMGMMQKMQGMMKQMMSKMGAMMPEEGTENAGGMNPADMNTMRAMNIDTSNPKARAA